MCDLTRLDNVDIVFFDVRQWSRCCTHDELECIFKWLFGNRHRHKACDIVIDYVVGDTSLLEGHLNHRSNRSILKVQSDGVWITILLRVCAVRGNADNNRRGKNAGGAVQKHDARDPSSGVHDQKHHPLRQKRQ